MVSQVLFVIGIILCLVAVFYLTGQFLFVFKKAAYEGEKSKMTLKLFQSELEKKKAEIKKINETKDLSWEGFRKFVVEKLVKENDLITSVYMRPHNQKKLPPFNPGQFLTFKFNIKGTDYGVVRCYSLSDAPNEDFYRISVKKVPPPRDKPEAPAGLCSNWINDELKEGDIIDVKSPDGDFFSDTLDSFPIVICGGGIGITPILSMLKTHAQEKIEREIWFFYGARNKSDMAFAREIEQVKKEYSNVNINVCYSDPTDEDKEGVDYQHAERVSVELFKKVLPSSSYDFYLCGPPPFMESITNDLKEWGVKKDRIHFEAFGPATVKKAKPKVEGAPTFKVSFSKSGKDLAFDQADSILELAENNDVNIPSGCRTGKCGTCLVAIRSGEIDTNTEPSADVEAGSCLACISFPKTDVVIDS